MKRGIKISDRGVLTLSKEMWNALGNAESVTVYTDPWSAQIEITPSGNKPLHGRPPSPQLCLGKELQRLGIKQVIPGRRDVSFEDGKIVVWPILVIDG